MLKDNAFHIMESSTRQGRESHQGGLAGAVHCVNDPFVVPCEMSFSFPTTWSGISTSLSHFMVNPSTFYLVGQATILSSAEPVIFRK